MIVGSFIYSESRDWVSGKQKDVLLDKLLGIFNCEVNLANLGPSHLAYFGRMDLFLLGYVPVLCAE